jgi:hypothetical protein
MQPKRLAFVFGVLYWLSVIVLGYFDRFFPTPSPSTSGYYALTIIITTCIVFMWFHYDARSRDYAYSGKLRLGVLLCAAFAVPVYLVKSRGWKRATWAIAKWLIAFMLVNAVLTMLNYL